MIGQAPDITEEASGVVQTWLEAERDKARFEAEQKIALFTIGGVVLGFLIGTYYGKKR